MSECDCCGYAGKNLKEHRKALKIAAGERMAELEAENADLKKDKERLEWCASNQAEFYRDDPWLIIRWISPTGDWCDEAESVMAKDWRDAIDEAMAKEAGDE